MKKYTETRKMHRDDLRSLCIKHDWYTHGNNEEYSALLDMTGLEMTTLNLVKIAEDIKAHSDTEYEITSILFELAETCFTVFNEI